MTEQTSDKPELTPQEQKILSESPAHSPNLMDSTSDDDDPSADADQSQP